MVTQSKSICAICAWRGTCQKMFSLSGRDINCPDYTRDITIKDKPNKDVQPNKD